MRRRVYARRRERMIAIMVMNVIRLGRMQPPIRIHERLSGCLRRARWRIRARRRHEAMLRLVIFYVSRADT